jgi:hypothetical protein
MIDGFHWTRVTSKHLRFLCEEITQATLPQHMCELAALSDRTLAAMGPEASTSIQHCSDDHAALRNRHDRSDV